MEVVGGWGRRRWREGEGIRSRDAGVDERRKARPSKGGGGGEEGGRWGWGALRCHLRRHMWH